MAGEVHIAMNGASLQTSGLQPAEEPVPLFLEEALAGRVKIGPGLLGKPTDGILTEDSFKELLPHHGRSPGNAYLQSGQTGSHGETTTISAAPRPFTPKESQRACVRFS